MRALAWDEPLVWVTWKVVAVPAGASFHETVKVTPFWLIVLMQGIRATGVSGLISPLTSWGMGNLSHEVMTDASSFSTATRQACASMGTALMVFMVSFVPEIGMTSLMGYQLAFAVSALFSLLMFLSAVLWVRR